VYEIDKWYAHLCNIVRSRSMITDAFSRRFITIGISRAHTFLRTTILLVIEICVTNQCSRSDSGDSSTMAMVCGCQVVAAHTLYFISPLSPSSVHFRDSPSVANIITRHLGLSSSLHDAYTYTLARWHPSPAETVHRVRCSSLIH